MVAALAIGAFAAAWLLWDIPLLPGVIQRLFNEMTRGHVLAYRLTGGLVGQHVPGLPPMLLLDHVGAKSGKQRTTPLVYLRDGEDIVIVASKGGSRRNPAWFHNLRANPETTVQVGSKRLSVTARVASPEERERLWPKVVAAYGGYESYQERTRARDPAGDPRELGRGLRALALALGLAQLDAADLARQRLGQVVDELHLARVGVGGVALAHEAA